MVVVVEVVETDQALEVVWSIMAEQVVVFLHKLVVLVQQAEEA